MSHVPRFLDKCWAVCLGSSVSQLRDGGRHVVPCPVSTGDVKRPYPLRHDSVSLMSCGEGWVLSVPGELVGRATKACGHLSFAEIVDDGDRLAEQWFATRGTDAEKKRPGAAGYRAMCWAAESLRIRGWSHYFLWYSDADTWRRRPIDDHVQRISEEAPLVWDQWASGRWEIGGIACSNSHDVADAFGYVLDGKLVSVSQVLAMRDDFAWEIGANTLPEFRGRGFATEACRAATAFILDQGRTASYYHDHYNRPSARLPHKLGYSLYAEGLFSHNE